MSGIVLTEVADATIPTPAAGKVTQYHSTEEGGPAYKDDTGTVHGLTGATGATGAAGADGADGADGAGYGGTSTTSLAIGTGSKAFTTQADLAYVVGSRVRAASAADPADFMEGVVTAYTGTTLTILVDLIGGAGTDADWNLSIAGEPGSGTDADTLTTTETDTSLRLAPDGAGGVEWAAGGGGGALELIAEVNLASDAANMDFTSIPGTYRHLRLEFWGRSARAGQALDLLGIRFNGDTGNNYDAASAFWASGSGGPSSGAAGTEWQMNIGATNATANSATAVGIDIPFYADTSFWKTARGLSLLYYSEIQGEARMCAWRSTTAITQITLRCVNANILAGSRATLYGIT